MRAGILTKEYPPEVYGGAGVHVEFLTRALSKLVDVEVHCFGAPRSADVELRAYHPPVELPARDEASDQALRALGVDVLMAAHVGNCDVVHSHTWYTNFAGHLARMLHDVPHVLTAHSLEPLRPWKAEQLGGGYRLSSFCERTAFESADAVIAVSSGMREDVLRCYPAVDASRVVVIHNGVDTDAFRPISDASVLERYRVDASRPMVLFVGRITHQKGLTHLLAAAEHLDPSAQIVVCATAWDSDALASWLGERISDAAERGRSVRWIKARLETCELAALMSHATVLVCPSIYEPFGLVNAEAMACGTAVVATRVGGIPEIVEDGVTGYLVGFERTGDEYGTPRDPIVLAHDLADRINELAADPGRAAEMGRRGRERMLSSFSWDVIAERTVALYAKVLAG